MSLLHITTHATGQKFHMGYSFLTVVSASRKHHMQLIDMNPGKRARSPALGRLPAPVTFATDSGLITLVRRTLAHHYLPGQDSRGPSWLAFLGRMKDSHGSVQVRIGDVADPLGPGLQFTSCGGDPGFSCLNNVVR